MDDYIMIRATCENAIRSLGLILENLNVNAKIFRPAGCYWQSGGKGFFNTNKKSLTDPSLTDPNSFSNRGGVCMKAGKNCSRFS